MQIQRGAGLVEHIWKNVKVNKSTLLELPSKKTNLHIYENISKNIIY